MSTIDTVESVREIAADLREEGLRYTAEILTRYAALLEAVNRPVTDEQVQIVADKLDDLFSVEDAQEPAFLADVRDILETYMESLREEVGK